MKVWNFEVLRFGPLSSPGSAHFSILDPSFSINLDLGKWTSGIFLQAWIPLLLTELVWKDPFSSHLAIPLLFLWNYVSPNLTILPNLGSGHFLKSNIPTFSFLGPSNMESGLFFADTGMGSVSVSREEEGVH